MVGAGPARARRGPQPSNVDRLEDRLDAAGRPEQFEQAGGQLRFTDYAGETAAALPSRIEAQQGEWLAIVLLQSLTLTP